MHRIFAMMKFVPTTAIKEFSYIRLNLIYNDEINSVVYGQHSLR